MTRRHIGRIAVYGACFLVAVAVALIWPDAKMAWVAVGMFVVRLMDALLGEGEE